jgi:hypothetical protein
VCAPLPRLSLSAATGWIWSPTLTGNRPTSPSDHTLEADPVPFSPSWKPLFAESEATAYRAAIVAIRDAFPDRPAHFVDWGVPLLHHYFAVASGSLGDKRRTELCRREVRHAIATMPLRPALYGGVAGAGWLLAHLDRLRARSPEDREYRELDEALLQFVRSWDGANYDLISGIVGIGVYFLERWPHAIAADGLRRVVASLEAHAEISSDEATWFTPATMLPPWQRTQAPDGYYNLGIAHGVPGVLAFLCEVRQHDIASAATLRALISMAFRWIRRRRLETGGFSTWVGANMPSVRARLSWCYGELGLSLPLLMAARAMGDAEAEEFALRVAIDAAARRDTTSIYDAGLCHGAAGNGHLFNRLFQATGLEEFRVAARFWFGVALGMRVEGTAAGGFRAWRPQISAGGQVSPCWEESHAFLDGSSGIALAFLSAVAPIEPAWDRVLLASVGSPV